MARTLLAFLCALACTTFCYQMFNVRDKYQELDDTIGDNMFGGFVSKFAKQIVEMRLESLGTNAFIFFVLTCILLLMQTRKPTPAAT